MEKEWGLTRDIYNGSDKTNPVVIAIEGLDGSGKTVQTSLLHTCLVQAGKKVLMLDFPQYNSFFGTEIGLLLSGKKETSAMNLDPKSMCLWYAVDRWKALSPHDLATYDYVLFNRYTMSNAVYQTARQFHAYHEAFIDWVFELEHSQLGLPVPNMYLFLNAVPEEAQGNVAKKEERTYVDGLDIYEQSASLLSCCRGIYLELAGKMPILNVIPCCSEKGAMDSIPAIQERILEAIKNKGLFV